MNTVKKFKNTPPQRLLYCSTFPFFFFQISLFQTSTYLKKLLRVSIVVWSDFERVHFGSKLSLCLRSGTLTARRTDGSNRTAMIFEDIKESCAHPAPPCLIPRRRHSHVTITCRKHPVPCWRCGSCRAVSELSWGSRGWGFVRSLRRSRCHSSWSEWSSAWRRWWIAVRKKQRDYS